MLTIPDPQPRARVLTAAAFLVLLSACADPASPPNSAAFADAPWDTTPMRRGELVQTWLLAGELQAIGGAQILVPRLPAWETTVRYVVADGAVVKEGDRLVELDTSQIAAELDNKVAQRELAANELASKRAEVAGQIAQKELVLRKAEIALRRAEIQASVPEDLQARKDYLEARINAENARVELEKAAADLDGYRRASDADLEVQRIELRRADRELEEARAAIATMVLRAPRDGIVVIAENRREDRKYLEGDTISVGTTVAEIPDLEAMAVRAWLSDVDDGKIAVGMPVRCVLDAYPDRVFSGRVQSISPVAQESNRRSMQRHFDVRIELLEVDTTIMRPGMSVRVEVESGRVQDASIVPRGALRFDGGEVSYRRPDGSVIAVEVELCTATECALRGVES